MFDKHQNSAPKGSTGGKNMQGKSDDSMSMFSAFGGGLTPEEKQEMKRRIMERIEREEAKKNT